MAALLVFSSWPAFGQRVQFPTAVPASGPAASSPGTWTAPGAAAGTSSPYPPVTPPSYPLQPVPGAAPNLVPSYTPPPSYDIGVPPGPTATFQGNIQPAPTWDPYGAPGAQPSTLFPQDPCPPAGPQLQPANTMTTMRRFLQQIHLDYVWIPGNGSDELGANDVDLGATFAIPFLYNRQTPLLVTPGFAAHFWNGPSDGTHHFPPRTYDAYLDTAWHPQVNPFLGSDLGFRIGVYSDFGKVVSESIRYQSHGLAVLSFSPSFQVKAGVVYLDRVKVKLLPAGGIVWTPNADVRFEILFPYPKLSRRLTTYGNTDWWIYLRGEYGGGSWTVTRPGAPVQVDYNDLRVAVGVEFQTLKEFVGLFEVGVAFEREMVYKDRINSPFNPNPSVFLRGSVAY